MGEPEILAEQSKPLKGRRIHVVLRNGIPKREICLALGANRCHKKEPQAVYAWVCLQVMTTNDFMTGRRGVSGDGGSRPVCLFVVNPNRQLEVAGRRQDHFVALVGRVNRYSRRVTKARDLASASKRRSGAEQAVAHFRGSIR